MNVHTRRRRAGFSLTEMLVVVGIIAILLGVAVPSILYYQRDLKLTELDDNARAVFVAAQNHLTALRSASAGELELDTPTKTVGRPAQAVPAGATEAGVELMYVSTDVTGAEPGWLVLPGAIESELAEGCYLVEFEPKSGSVYGVFFIERSGSQALNESTYQRIYQYSDGGNTCRVRAGRKALSKAAGGLYVGYYGADGALDMDRPNAQTLPQPKLKLVNAEELVLEIGTDSASWPSTIDQDKVYASVTVSDGAVVKPLVTKGAVRSGMGGTVVLDTLKATAYTQNATPTTAGWTVGNSFDKWMEEGSGYTITPGADITVTVSIWYDGDSVVALPQSAAVTTNSLFAARSGGAVNIAYGRHLQNLGQSYLDSAVTDAKQTRAIDFGRAGGGRYSWEDTYGHDARPFVPVTNANLDSYSGGGLVIKNLNAVQASPDRYENAGLFGVFSGTTLEDIVLVDARATGNNAGALAGTVSNGGGVDVNGCQSYLTTPTSATRRVQGGVCAGGLIGRAENCVINNSFASTVVSGPTVGGLVGLGDILPVQNSYAAGRLSGGSVGGLVGRGSGIRILNCYAAGTIVRANTAAGGLSAGAATVQNAYAAVDYVEKPGEGAVYFGAVASGGKGNVHYLVKSGFNDAVTVAGVTPVTSPKKMETPGDLGLSTQFFTSGENTVTNPYNLSNQPDGSPRDPRLSAPYPYPALSVEGNPVPHYGDWLEGSALRGVVAYYEQYESGSELKTDFFYYELNGEGALETKGSLNATDTLYSDGYAFLSLNQLHEDGQSVVPMMVAIGADAEMKEYSTTYLGTYVDGLVTYYAYGLPNSALDTAVAAADYFLQLRVAGLDSSAELSSLWLNPHFGKTAYNGYGETNPSKSTVHKVPVPDGTGDVIPIRSVRQFNNMRKYPSDIKSWTQELEMDAARYQGHLDMDAEGYLTLGGLRVTTLQPDKTWKPIKPAGATPTRADIPASYRLAMPPIAMNYSSTTFGGAYDGKGHTIRNLSIGSHGVGASEQYAALFYRLAGSATLKDIHLVQCDVTGVSGANKNYVGALVGYTEGTVLGCSVEEVSIQAPQTGTKAGGFVGGLVGYVRKGAVGSALAPCQVVNCVVDGGGASYVGGFAGGISEGTVQYAGVRVEGEDRDGLYKTKSVTGADYAGGFAGIVGHEKRKGTVQYCYAAVKVSGMTAGGFTGTMTEGTVSNCYAGGHTQNGVYLPSLVNVSGTGNAGGFAGTWSGGTLNGLCYTTCGVSGASKADVFAVASGKSVPTGCYAGGDVFLNGSLSPASSHNSTQAVIGTLPGEAEAAQAAAHPYDVTLPDKYPYKPIIVGDAPMAHYGDWRVKKGSAQRPWVQQISDPKPKEYPNFSAGASWEGDTLHISFDVECADGSQNAANSGPNNNGVYAITTDLGYKLIFRIIYNGDGTYTIDGADGSTWTCRETAPLGDPDRHIIFDFTIPTELIPPYMESISVGAMEDEHIVDNIKNTDPSYKGLEHLGVEETITVDGDFSDWLGYEHQVMEGIPGGENTPLHGHWTGSILGTNNKIFIHMINEDKTDMPQYQTNLNGVGIFKMNFASDDIDLKTYEWIWMLGNNPYPSTIPASQEYTVGPERWGPNETGAWVLLEKMNIIHFVLNVTEDRQEYEMEIDLDAWARYLGEENGDVINDFKVTLGDSGRVLEVKRDPNKTT